MASKPVRGRDIARQEGGAQWDKVAEVVQMEKALGNCGPRHGAGRWI